MTRTRCLKSAKTASKINILYPRERARTMGRSLRASGRIRAKRNSQERAQRGAKRDSYRLPTHTLYTYITRLNFSTCACVRAYTYICIPAPPPAADLKRVHNIVAAPQRPPTAVILAAALGAISIGSPSTCTCGFAAPKRSCVF